MIRRDMANSLIARKRIRKNFGKIAEVAEMPNLIEVQKTSYDQFLQLGIPVSQRSNTGLQEVFTSVFPIRDFSERAELQFVRARKITRLNFSPSCASRMPS